MTLQIPVAEPLGRPRTRTGVTAWVDEWTVSEQRAHLRVGQNLQAPAWPARSGAMEGLLSHLLERGQTCWELHPEVGEDSVAVDGLRLLQGQIGAIAAVVVPHRLGIGGVWEPVAGAARRRPVVSTCTPEPARSVWIPSGSPVLIGFLVTVEDAFFTRQPH